MDNNFIFNLNLIKFADKQDKQKILAEFIMGLLAF